LIYAANRNEDPATIPAKWAGIRLSHFLELDESPSKIPSLSMRRLILLSRLSTEHDEYDSFYSKGYKWYPTVMYPHRIKASTKRPNTFSIDLEVREKEYYNSEVKAGCGHFICNYLEALGMHPVAGSYIKEENQDPESYYEDIIYTMRLVIEINEEGVDYSHYYSKEFWENECFKDDVVVTVQNNKMKEYI